MKNEHDNNDIQEGADFRIDLDGQWHHEGEPIKREALARLFSDRALKIDEEGRYWLQTPFEKYPVEVADVPYIIVDFRIDRDRIELISNMNEQVTLGEAHPLELRYNDFYAMDLPYVHIRGGLYARLGRNVYYALAEEFGTHVTSEGQCFALGRMSEVDQS